MPEFLSSKLTPPVTAIKPLLRERLDLPTAFTNGQQNLLALCAPAGYGKSTLLMQWWLNLEQQGVGCAWLGLDAQDAIAKRFEGALLGALGAFDSEDLNAVLLRLDQDKQRRVLFIDDVHFLNAQEAEHVLHWLLDNLPAGLQLIMAGRSLPESVAISRRVLEGRALRYDNRELALSREELAAMLETDVEQDWLTNLHLQTEGWPLAARIVSLSKDEDGKVRPPTGHDRDLSAYLTDVLLKGLPGEMRSLVFAAALLPRFCAEQLDAVLEQNGSAQGLLWLEQNNLFLVPLDRDRRWYRFHHLIGEFLSGRLYAENPELMQQWQRRAGNWFDQNDHYEDAIDLAIAGKEYSIAAQRIERVSVLISQYDGRHERMVEWVAQLPQEAIQNAFLLRLNHIVAMTFTGQLNWARAAALELLKDVYGKVDEKDQAQFESAAEVFACIIAALEDEPELAESLSLSWLKRWPDGSPLFTGAAFSTRGFAAKCRSAFDEALTFTQRGKQLFVKAGSVYGEAWASALLAITLLRMGALSQAKDVAEASLQSATRHLGSSAPSTGVLRALLASIHLESGRLEEAEKALGFDFELMQAQSSADGLIAAWLTAARIKLAKGQAKAAQALLLEGEAVGQERGLPRLVLTLAAERAANHIQSGQLALARNIIASEFAPFESREDLQGLIEDKRLQLDVRLALASEQQQQILPKLVEQIARASEMGQQLKLLQWYVFAAAAGSDESVDYLVKALKLVEATGALRILIADVELIRPHFSAALEKAGLPVVLAERLRMSVGVESLPVAAQLTNKELQILKSVAEGLSNKELAAKLFVSEGTVKWHLHNIYSKLEAKNRSAALAKARAAGLIS